MPIEGLDNLNDEEREMATKRRMKNGSLNDLEHAYEVLQNFNHFVLPSIPFLFKDRLPEVTGVYIVYMNNDIYYIGQAKNIAQRWKNHGIADKLAIRDGFVANNDLRIGWLECNTRLLNFVEIYLIGLLHPVLNIAHKNID